MMRNSGRYEVSRGPGSPLRATVLLLFRGDPLLDGFHLDAEFPGNGLDRLLFSTHLPGSVDPGPVGPGPAGRGAVFLVRPCCLRGQLKPLPAAPALPVFLV